MRSVPAQRFDSELADEPIADLDLLAGNFRDMVAADRFLGGRRGLFKRVVGWLQTMPADYTATILDIATGSAEGPLALVNWAGRRKNNVHVIAGDIGYHVMDVARRRVSASAISLLQHDALALPFAAKSVDIVTCTQALHHFQPAEVVKLLREMARVARLGVVINDLRRCWGGYLGARLLALGADNSLSRHDGPLSVLRAYTRAEAQQLLDQAKTGGTAYAEPVFRLSLILDTYQLWHAEEQSR
ncbi:MAG: hypothetical protein NVSMB42_12640 [Herpetosiphon sp.]